MKTITEALLNIFRKPFTENYPKEKKEPLGKFRGRIKYDSEKCIGCRLCEKNCPANAITFHEKGKIDFDMGKCVLCGLCRDVCPVKCIEYTKKFDHVEKDEKDLVVRDY